MNTVADYAAVAIDEETTDTDENYTSDEEIEIEDEDDQFGTDDNNDEETTDTDENYTSDEEIEDEEQDDQLRFSTDDNNMRVRRVRLFPCHTCQGNGNLCANICIYCNRRECELCEHNQLDALRPICSVCNRECIYC
jgi:hypothetical protein